MENTKRWQRHPWPTEAQSLGTCSGGSAPRPPDAGTGGGQAPMSHPGPVCVSCFLLPPPLRPAGTGPPWSSSSSSPTARGPRPLLFFTPRVPTLTPSLQCCSAPGPPTNLPTSLPNPLPAPCLRFMVGKGSLAAPPMCVPTLRLSTWSLGLALWAPPRADSLQASRVLAGAPIYPVLAWAGPCTLATGSS